jgi:hypothetical protein
MGTRVAGLTGATLETTPSVCHECVWWQSRSGRGTEKRRWIEKIEDESGAWGAVYHDDDGRLLGSMQFGPSHFFPRAQELPAGPPTDDAFLITCAYLVEPSTPWVMQSLFLTAIGEARDRRAPALETFAYRYRRASQRTSASRCIARCFRVTSSRTSDSARCVRRDESSSAGSSSAACSPCSKASARTSCASCVKCSRRLRCRSAFPRRGTAREAARRLGGRSA